VATGPTAERLAKAENHYAKGDDKRGNVVYQFHDSPLDRLYSRLAKQAKSLGSQDGLRREYTALTKYRHHWRAAGLQDSIGSADLNRVFASDPGSMSGMAKTEGQAHHRKQYRDAVDEIGWKPHIVVDNIVCAETSIESAGWSIGYNSRTQARDCAEEMLRDGEAVGDIVLGKLASAVGDIVSHTDSGLHQGMGSFGQHRVAEVFHRLLPWHEAGIGGRIPRGRKRLQQIADALDAHDLTLRHKSPQIRHHRDLRRGQLNISPGFAFLA
jgi:hypothetical protein